MNKELSQYAKYSTGELCSQWALCMKSTDPDIIYSPHMAAICHELSIREISPWDIQTMMGTVNYRRIEPSND